MMSVSYNDSSKALGVVTSRMFWVSHGFPSCVTSLSRFNRFNLYESISFMKKESSPLQYGLIYNFKNPEPWRRP
jgi:hypothetical protein